MKPQNKTEKENKQKQDS